MIYAYIFFIFIFLDIVLIGIVVYGHFYENDNKVRYKLTHTAHHPEYKIKISYVERYTKTYYIIIRYIELLFYGEKVKVERIKKEKELD